MSAAFNKPSVSDVRKFVSGCQLGNMDAVERYIQAYPDHLDELGGGSGNTGLMFAAIEHKHDVMRRLIEAGARVDVRSDWDMTALMHAVSHDKNETSELQQTVRILLDAGADVTLTSGKKNPLPHLQNKSIAAMARSYGNEKSALMIEAEFLRRAMVIQQAAEEQKRAQQALIDADVRHIHDGITVPMQVRSIKLKHK